MLFSGAGGLFRLLLSSTELRFQSLYSANEVPKMQIYSFKVVKLLFSIPFCVSSCAILVIFA